MLILYETPAGYALFKCNDMNKLTNVDNIYKYFETSDSATSLLKLISFKKFDDTNEALDAATALCEGTLDKNLKKFLKKSIIKKELTDQLGVIDAKLGNLIKSKLEIDCVADNSISELMRGIRQQLGALISGLTEADYKQMV